MQPLEGKVALVTGGSTETAQAVALSLAGLGATICMTGQQPESLERAARAIQAKGGRCLAFPADVTQENEVGRLMAATLENFGRLDILVSISAVWGGGPVHSHPVTAWDLVMAANLRSNFLLARAALPVLRHQRGGHLILIASDSALEYYEGEGAYGVSMHALVHLSEYIRRENRDYSIQVSCLCPGLVQTPVSGHEGPASLRPEDVSQWVACLVTGRPGATIPGPILIQPD
jgi:NAD(P)-dependent dehydrogenase (short-subunit alcohol dehydrogenase family)